VKKYKVELEQTRTVYVDAENPYMAAIAAVDGDGATTTVREVAQAHGRIPKAVRVTNPSQPEGRTGSPVAVKRRLSPEGRAKLVANAATARAAKARKAAKRKRATK